MNCVFVYGTLKEGFANFRINAGRRLTGSFRTLDRYPLFIVGEYFIPWLVDQRGAGEQVVGQVFQVDDRDLEAMDRLERVSEPGWYSRVEIQVQEQGLAAPQPITAFVYFGSAARAASERVHAGPLVEFTTVHDLEYRRRRAGS